MAIPYIVRTSGVGGQSTDFSDCKAIIFCNTSGYALSNPAIRVINTNGPYGVATDFSSLKAVIFVNTSGIAPF